MLYNVAYLLIACIPEPPLNRGQNGEKSFNTNSTCQLRALSAISLCLEVPVWYAHRTPSSSEDRELGIGNVNHKDREKARDIWFFFAGR